MTAFILDAVTLKPGYAAQFRTRYRQGYMPGAVRRGMRLHGAWQSPPADIVEVAMTMYYLWAVDDVGGWWAARFSRTPDGADERFEKATFWQECDAMILGRERRMLAALSEPE